MPGGQRLQVYPVAAMSAVWVIWLLVIALSFAGFEGHALRTGRSTLSRFVWNLNKGFPPLGWMVGIVVGFLGAHFFWPGMGCVITGF